MKEVDFAKLSEQYAGFLVAIGGVSITALALVLSLASPSNKLKDGDLGSFLISALIVATVCCFTGAHMMAETAALIGRTKEVLRDKPPNEIPDEIPATGSPLGERLFLLASTSIFIAISLVLFAVMLLPAASTLTDAGSVRWVSILVFICVAVGALSWMVLAAEHRMSVKVRRDDTIKALRKGLLLGSIPTVFSVIDRRLLLGLTFVPITVLVAATLIYFAWNLKDSDNEKASGRQLNIRDILFFVSAVTGSYTALVLAGVRVMFW